MYPVVCFWGFYYLRVEPALCELTHTCAAKTLNNKFQMRFQRKFQLRDNRVKGTGTETGGEEGAVAATLQTGRNCAHLMWS